MADIRTKNQQKACRQGAAFWEPAAFAASLVWFVVWADEGKNRQLLHAKNVSRCADGVLPEIAGVL